MTTPARSPVAAELAHVGLAGADLDACLLGPERERLEQLGSAVDRDHVETAAREVEADAAGAGAEVEDGPGRVRREPLPEPQVGAVGAVLGVVPDDRAAHRGRRVHRYSQ